MTNIHTLTSLSADEPPEHQLFIVGETPSRSATQGFDWLAHFIWKAERERFGVDRVYVPQDHFFPTPISFPEFDGKSCGKGMALVRPIVAFVSKGEYDAEAVYSVFEQTWNVFTDNIIDKFEDYLEQELSLDECADIAQTGLPLIGGLNCAGRLSRDIEMSQIHDFFKRGKEELDKGFNYAEVLGVYLELELPYPKSMRMGEISRKTERYLDHFASLSERVSEQRFSKIRKSSKPGYRMVPDRGSIQTPMYSTLNKLSK